ncbi:hypothetical protein DPMN_127332 [Dreissena polymorpha]|uniref:Uncharacterized protein n=1 Tax=Dreissena polymorpha TaxID=45954 RepID=A0A9D4JYQ8_DREPO|nr:hypothetical protein DPMN_127332 [Dreissena polymorpha]
MKATLLWIVIVSVVVSLTIAEEECEANGKLYAPGEVFIDWLDDVCQECACDRFGLASPCIKVPESVIRSYCPSL